MAFRARLFPSNLAEVPMVEEKNATVVDGE